MNGTEESSHLAHIPTDCEGPVKPVDSQRASTEPEFLGTRVGVIITYIGEQAVRVNCPFNKDDICTNHPEGDEFYPCHRLDNVLDRGYRFTARDIGAEVYSITGEDSFYTVVRIDDDSDKIVLAQADDDSIKLSMVRSREYENVFIAEEPMANGLMLMLQILRFNDGRREFIVFTDVKPY